MKKYFVVLIILALLGCNVESLIAQSLEDGLVAYYPFNGNANDESVNSNNGTVNGATLTTDRHGNSNSAYSFDGVDDFISIGSPTSLKITMDITISTWIKANSLAKSYLIHCGGGGDTEPTNMLYVIILENDGKLSWFHEYSTSGTNVILTTTNAHIQPNNFYNISIIRSSITKTVSFYINGELVESISFPANATGGTSGNVTIASRGTESFYNGIMDDIRIYNRILDSTEIKELYDEGKKPLITTHPQSKTICKGQNSALIVSASGATPITYQWQKDGSNIPSAIDSLYIIADAQLTDAGSYTCIATNIYGSDTSDVAILAVQTVSPATIIGLTQVTELQTATYSVTEQTGHTYDFSVTGGNKISNTANSITVQWGTIGLGYVFLVETNSSGCVGDTVDLEVAVGNVGISDNNIREKEAYYPNPVSKYLHFNKKQKIEIYSLEGKSLLSTYSNRIDISTLTNGLYILRINNNNSKFIKR